MATWACHKMKYLILWPLDLHNICIILVNVVLFLFWNRKKEISDSVHHLFVESLVLFVNPVTTLKG